MSSKIQTGKNLPVSCLVPGSWFQPLPPHKAKPKLFFCLRLLSDVHNVHHLRLLVQHAEHGFPLPLPLSVRFTVAAAPAGGAEWWLPLAGRVGAPRVPDVHHACSGGERGGRARRITQGPCGSWPLHVRLCLSAFAVTDDSRVAGAETWNAKWIN